MVGGRKLCRVIAEAEGALAKGLHHGKWTHIREDKEGWGTPERR